MKNIIFENVSKSYGDVEVVKKLNFEVDAGERLILLGPSGCGKSTTLRMIAGLESITAGNLYMDGKIMNNVKSGDRNVSMVFQNYALYPHMSVKENITYGLKRNKIANSEIERRFEAAVATLHLEGHVDKKPKDLSGGQKQRVALARAIVKQADYFLLDEPLSNLDAQLRIHARKELVKIHEMYESTFVYVTHDQVEAMTMGQKVAILNDGVLQMHDTPETIYNKPKNVFVAKFIGTPPTNIFNANFVDGELYLEDVKIDINTVETQALKEKGVSKMFLGIRPEDLSICNEDEAHLRNVCINYVEDYGERRGAFCQIGNQELVFLSQRLDLKEEQVVSLKLNEEKLHFFDWNTEERIFN